MQSFGVAFALYIYVFPYDYAILITYPQFSFLLLFLRSFSQSGWKVMEYLPSHLSAETLTCFLITIKVWYINLWSLQDNLILYAKSESEKDSLKFITRTCIPIAKLQEPCNVFGNLCEPVMPQCLFSQAYRLPLNIYI